MRELERERTNLQRQEKNLTIEIKQMAKKGQMVRSSSGAVLTSFIYELDYSFSLFFFLFEI